jgi:HAE1 family hydrophobic/amphiphilic exporter-1
MYLSRVCIKRPVFATVISLMMVAVGLLFLMKLPILAMPDVDHPIITVQANYEGASAEYMERNVTTRIEKTLKTVQKIENISSETSAGISIITLSFDMSAI